MIIVLGLVWLILSIYAIYYTDYYYYWDKLFTVYISASILALILNTWIVYEPSMGHMVVTIEINPTFDLALGLAFIEGICITGPIAGLHILKEKIKERRG